MVAEKMDDTVPRPQVPEYVPEEKDGEGDEKVWYCGEGLPQDKRSNRSFRLKGNSEKIHWQRGNL